MTTYRDSGVDIDAGNRTVELIKPLAAATQGPEVLAGVGPFSGLFALDTRRYRQPVLVASTDGVGTKVLLAAGAGRHGQIGADSLKYLSKAGLFRAVKNVNGFCMACFDGDYPVPVPVQLEMDKMALETVAR